MELTYQVLRTSLKSENMHSGVYYALLPIWFSTKEGRREAYVPTFRTKEEAVAFINEESTANGGEFTILEVYQKYPSYTK